MIDAALPRLAWPPSASPSTVVHFALHTSLRIGSADTRTIDAMHVAVVAMPCGAAAGRRCGAAQLTAEWSAPTTLHVQSGGDASTCIAIASARGTTVARVEGLVGSQ